MTELDRIMQKMKDMGVTININTGGREPSGVSAVMKQAAQDAGIYYENTKENQ